MVNHGDKKIITTDSINGKLYAVFTYVVHTEGCKFWQQVSKWYLTKKSAEKKLQYLKEHNCYV